MSQTTTIACACGKTRLEVSGAPMLVTECLCDSCTAAAERLARLPGAGNMLTAHGATPCAEYRKDRVRIVSGSEHLGEFRLTPQAGSRRVVATCCNTPVFLELKGAHWLGVYLHLWPPHARPKVDVRTMASDRADAASLPNDIPNLKTQSMSFYAKLLGAWIAMGFRNPSIPVTEKIHA